MNPRSAPVGPPQVRHHSCPPSTVCAAHSNRFITRRYSASVTGCWQQGHT